MVFLFFFWVEKFAKVFISQLLKEKQALIITSQKERMKEKVILKEISGKKNNLTRALIGHFLHVYAKEK
jgi:hypothetical protein